MATLQKYRAMLPVNKHRLDDELEVQAEIQERISAEVVALNSSMLQAKDDLGKIESRLFLDLKDDGDKQTEAQIRARISRHEERVRAWRTFQEARQELELWEGLLKAWEKRGYSISTLADLYGRQYFSLRSAGTRESPQERMTREDAKREMRDERIAQRFRQSVDESKPSHIAPRARRRAED